MWSLRQLDSTVPAGRSDAGAAPDGGSLEVEIPVSFEHLNVFASTGSGAELTKWRDVRLQQRISWQVLTVARQPFLKTSTRSGYPENKALKWRLIRLSGGLGGPLKGVSARVSPRDSRPAGKYKLAMEPRAARAGKESIRRNPLRSYFLAFYAETG
jgi:hypothetical protein